MEGSAANNLCEAIESLFFQLSWALSPPGLGLQELPLPVSVVSCACGAQHMLLLSGEGLVFAQGTGPQLGLGEVQQATSPAPRRQVNPKIVAINRLPGRCQFLIVINYSKRHS